MTDKIKETEGLPCVRRKKSLQGHQYRRKPKVLSEQCDAKLSCVRGLIVKNNSAFSCDESSGNIAYPAGCVIIVHQTREKSQFYIFNPGHKNITCLQYSLDGQNIVTGESGHLPCVRVFSVSERCQIASFQSHKFGISCVAFAPNSQYIVSIGYQHDNVINVWNWKKNILSASNKVSIKVRAIAFSENSSYFVTVGNRHIKFWYIESPKVSDKLTIPLKGRSGILGSVRNQLFCDVSCGLGIDSGNTFAVSRSGMLCQFNCRRTLERSVQIETTSAYSICVVNGTIVCGCSGSKVFLYSTADLQVITWFNSSGIEPESTDLVAVTMDSKNMWIHCVHSDHSLYTWDMLDMNNPVEHSANLFHSGCVWDVKIHKSDDPAFSFVSCSSDGTVRKWKIDHDNCTSSSYFTTEPKSANKTSPDEKGGEKVGVRALCLLRDGQQIAVGDRNGVICIYSLSDERPKELAKRKLHDGDILSLDYSASHDILVSASRDRCIYIQDKKHEPIYTINDHSAAITAVKFVNLCDKLHLISCGVDKSLYFCTVTPHEGSIKVVREQHIVEKHAMHDMSVVNDSVLVACGAGLYEYDIENGKLQRYLGSCESSATILRVTVDSNAAFIATSCADKYIYIWNYQTGDCLLDLGCHSEVCTAIAFCTNVSQTYLISATADSCIFLWKVKKYSRGELPSNIVSESNEENHIISNGINMSGYFGEPPHGLGSPNLEILPANDMKETSGDDDVEICASGEKEENDMLPSWITGKRGKGANNLAPRGKWASRIQEHQFNMLDTPIYQPDWEISQTESADETEKADNQDILSDDDINDVMPDEKSLNDNETKLLKQTCGAKVEQNVKSGSSCATVECERNAGSTCESTAIDDQNLISSQTPLSNQNDVSPHQQFPEDGSKICKLNSSPSADPGEAMVEDVVDKAEASAAIPPAFANFLENITKKKQRAVPASLAVRKSYRNNGEKDFDRFISSTDTTMADENKVLENNTETTASGNSCQEVIDKLLSAYEEAETLYKQSTNVPERPNDDQVRKLLSRAFSSLQDRICQLHGNNDKNLFDVKQMTPVMSLMQEYSEKLVNMVRDEVQNSL